MYQKVFRFILFFCLPPTIIAILIYSIHVDAEYAPKEPFLFVLAFFYFFFLIKKLLREAFEKKEDKLKNAYAGVWVFEACREGLAVRYDGLQKLVAWDQIAKIEMDATSLYLRMTNRENLIFPKKKVISGDYDGFVNAVQGQVARTIKVHNMTG